MKVTKPNDFKFSIASLIVMALLFWQTMKLPTSSVSNEVGPIFFPFIVLLVWTVLAILLLIGSFRPLNEEEKAAKAKKDARTPEQVAKAKLDFKRSMMFFGILFITVILINILGYFVSTTIGLTVCLTIIGWKWWKSLIYAVVANGILYAIFVYALYVPLPSGILF